MAAASEYVLEPIRDRAEFTLYRARQRGNPMPLLVVASTAEPPLPQTLRRLEHEYSLAAELEPAWAAKPLTLTRHEGRTILVLADPGGEPLDRVLERDREQPLDLARILPLAINLAAALGHVHQRGLIHKDVKPENVLVALEQSGDAGRVWLTGFGIASQLPRERQAPAPPEIIAGTLAYMSPEQTGRMNRSIDTQVLSDLSAPAYFTDSRLQCLRTCRTVRISLQHGISRDSAYAYANFGFVLSGRFIVTVMVIVFASWPATWSRSTASWRLKRKFTMQR